MPRLAGTLILLALALAGAGAPPAAAAGPAATRAELARLMGAAGAGSGALVADAETGAVLYASRDRVRRIPASVQKLYTTAAALYRLGPDTRLATEALAAGEVDPDGVLEGDLVLRGAGDPTFGTVQMTALARRVVTTTGLSRVAGRVVGDESAFDRRRGPPASGYRTSGYVGPLSALAFNRGLTGIRAPYFQVSPGLFAAQAFERALRREGVRMGARARTGVVPEAAVALGSVESPPLSVLVERTNRPSDNYFAETLLKVLGARVRGAGSTSGGARAVRDALRALGIGPRVSDGSGLGRANRTSPREVVTLLRSLAKDPVNGPPIEASLPVAGRSGTLTGRMRGTPAAGNCRAKTGSLNSVSALAGYCTARDGSRMAFAFLMNGVSLPGARALQDRMAAALARYEP